MNHTLNHDFQELNYNVQVMWYWETNARVQWFWITGKQCVRFILLFLATEL